MTEQTKSPRRYVTITAQGFPPTLDAPAKAIAWHYSTPIDDAGWIYDESTLDELLAADPSLVVMIVTEANHG